MVGFDGQMLCDVRRYNLSPGYDKVAVFSPRIAAINYEPGCHTAAPTCPVVESPKLILRHYNQLGEEYQIRRFARCKSRMSEENLRKGWGRQFLFSEETIRKYHQAALKSAIEE